MTLIKVLLPNDNRLMCLKVVEIHWYSLKNRLIMMGMIKASSD